MKGTEEDAQRWVDQARYFLRLFADVERMSVEELRQLARAKSSYALRFLDNARDGVRFGCRPQEVVYPPGTPASERPGTTQTKGEGTL